MEALTSDIYTLSLHDALPIYNAALYLRRPCLNGIASGTQISVSPRSFIYCVAVCAFQLDRKSTRLNSSHRCISYAVFCLKKKNIGTDGLGWHSGIWEVSRIVE